MGLIRKATPKVDGEIQELMLNCGLLFVAISPGLWGRRLRGLGRGLSQVTGSQSAPIQRGGSVGNLNEQSVFPGWTDVRQDYLK